MSRDLNKVKVVENYKRQVGVLITVIRLSLLTGSFSRLGFHPSTETRRCSPICLAEDISEGCSQVLKENTPGFQEITYTS